MEINGYGLRVSPGSEIYSFSDNMQNPSYNAPNKLKKCYEKPSRDIAKRYSGKGTLIDCFA